MALTNGVRQGRIVRSVSGQWRAMPDGIHRLGVAIALYLFCT